jgi:hypothetical protein
MNATAHAEDWDPKLEDEIFLEQQCANSGSCGFGSGHAARPSVDPCFIAQNAMRPCNSTPGQPLKPVVDPDTVGNWEIPVKNGFWVWEIHRDGTYRFHSEAGDGAPSHTGTFSSSNGNWSLKATTGYADNGTYLFQRPDILIAKGQLGTAAWRAQALKTASSKAKQ